MSKKSGKGGRRAVWMSKETMEKKKRISVGCKNSVWPLGRYIRMFSGHAVKKAKAYLEFNLFMKIKDNEKGFFMFTNSKRKTTENVDLLRMR